MRNYIEEVKLKSLISAGIVADAQIADYLQGVEYRKWLEAKRTEYTLIGSEINFEEWLAETIEVVIGTTTDTEGVATDIIETQVVHTYVPVAVDTQAFLATYKPYLRQLRDNLTVTINSGKIFGADIQARQNISDAIDLSGVLGITSTMWKLTDNSIVEVTVDELKEAKVLALTEFARLSGI